MSLNHFLNECETGASLQLTGTLYFYWYAIDLCFFIVLNLVGVKNFISQIQGFQQENKIQVKL